MARTATLSGTAGWSNAALFDGYVLVCVVLPSGYSYAAPAARPDLQLPQFTKVTIKAGQFDPLVRLFYNADLEPPNCRYAAYWYDSQGTLLSGPSAIFDITSDPFAITVPTLTAPSASVTAPTPPTVP